MSELKHVEIAEDNCKVAIDIANENQKYNLAYAFVHHQDTKEVISFWKQVKEAMRLSTLSNEELLSERDEITFSRMFLFFSGDIAIGYGGYYRLNDLVYVNYWDTIPGKGDFDTETSIIERIIQIVDKEEEDDVIHIQIDNRFESEKIAKFIFLNLAHAQGDPEHTLVGSIRIK